MYYTDNPVRDHAQWDAAQEALRQLLPRCSECNQLIEDEECYNLDGEAVCEECIPRFKVKTTYFMG